MPLSLTLSTPLRRLSPGGTGRLRARVENLTGPADPPVVHPWNRFILDEKTDVANLKDERDYLHCYQNMTHIEHYEQYFTIMERNRINVIKLK